MYYDAQLQLLRNTFRKCHVQSVIADLSLPLHAIPDLKLSGILNASAEQNRPLRDLLGNIEPETVYRLSDILGYRYLYFLLPELSKQLTLIIGPFLTAVPTKQQMMEWLEDQHITPSQQRRLEQLYANVPLLPENSHLFVLLDAFAEHLWGHSNYRFEDANLDLRDTLLPLIKKKASPEEEDTLWTMKNMEQRYAYENALMDAVSNGQVHKAELLLSSISPIMMEQRLSDPVANAKNYCIIMNTLSRKAAEKGGVHPIHLDRTSSDFALKITQLHSAEAATELMVDMFRTYCRLVRKQSMKNLSPLVQKAQIYIDAHLAEHLSLQTLADTLNISSSYLSALFHKETGQTVTGYISTRRIHQAMHLLETTKLQIQTIAQHCGIWDVQYFSKIFKRMTGVTPKAYRERLRR